MPGYGDYVPTMGDTHVAGNDYASDRSMGFKAEVSAVLESYQQRGTSLNDLMQQVLYSPTAREQFMDNVMESITSSPIFMDENCVNSRFYDNYADRLRQLEDNSMKQVAIESIVTGYSPIVAYNPFFLKKQWISTVFKDILMTEVPASPVINYAVEQRYLRTMDGTEYPIPDVYYDPAITRSLNAACTGAAIKEEPIPLTDLRGLSLIDPTYIPGIIKNDPAVELTQDITICAVTLEDGTVVPVNIRTDVTTHQWVRGQIEYKRTDSYGNVVSTVKDKIFGAVDFVTGKVTVLCQDGHVTHVTLRGKVANRWNDRSLTTIRRVEPIQFVMPESGQRLNTPITLEDAADALVTQNIDIIADNVDVMGRTLAEFEDFEIRDFLDASFDAQANAGSMAVSFVGSNSLIVQGHFDAMPYEGFTNNVTDWMKDSREYFERVLAGLKTKLKTDDVVVICYSHPNLVRFLQNGINWVFSDDTQISGMKISYNFGIYTSAQDRVHIVTSMYVPEDSGLHFVVIPTTKELITYKHFKYNAVIDRNYRDPVHPLTPNVMVTQRTLTCEVLPVQGRMTIGGRELYSPTSLRRVTPGNVAGAILGAAFSDAGLTATYSKNANGFTVNVAGTAAAGATTVDPDLFGTLNGNYAQVTIQLPGVTAAGSYIVKQTNGALAAYPDDPTIKQVDGEWVKTKQYAGTDLLDGYALLLAEGADATVQIFNAAAYIDGASPAVSTVEIKNGATFG
jgi:hypothetical protein